MTRVGEAAVKLQSINSSILDLSDSTWQTQSINGLRLVRRVFHLFSMVLERLEDLHHNNLVWDLLSKAYRMQLTCCFQMGYLAECERAQDMKATESLMPGQYDLSPK
jgi:hypothetical protein